MTHSYTVKGITCEGCVAKVKSKLLMHPDVLAADVKLEGQQAIITMQKHISTYELQAAIGVDTKYRISEDASAPFNHGIKDETAKSWLSTYKPLLIIGLFITGVSFITSEGNLHDGMNYFMAGFFLVFSFFKMLDIKGFASSYAMYDLLAIKIPVYGYIYPFIELGLGLAYLTEFNPFFTNMATIAVMGFSSIGVIKSVLNKQKIRCACLGAIFNLPMSTVTIIEDLLMVGMAAAMLVRL
ncbi:MAG: heavy metal-associated domain-containing protein [Cyclobacteriaceae bacterium]|jgi:cation transport ATPase|nr:heavy metal transporter [Cytophagales bacterium]HNP76471.1 heavy metal-associated domain-containing protein [Cyclobacteriaceae bacterium]